MKSQIKSFALLLAGATLVLSSCSNDVLLADETGANGPETSYSGKKFFLNAGIALPTTATRSATEDEDKVGGSGSDQTNSDIDKPNEDKKWDGADDFEYGYDYENDVRTMLLVFTTATADEKGDVDKFLFATEVSGIEKAPTGQSNYAFNVLAEVKYEDLKRLYDDGGVFSDPNGDRTVNVYAFCNYTSQLEDALMAVTDDDAKINKNYLKTDWIDAIGKINENASKAGKSPVIDNTIWAKRSFLMTNYTKNTVEFPKNLIGSKTGNEGWDDYSDKSAPFHITKYVDATTKDDAINPILVERSAARIDFRDGSKYYLDENKNVKVENAYPILTEVHLTKNDGSEENKEESTHNLYSVQLTRMALVNMSNQFYYLRRVSDDPAATDPKVKVGGVETSKNYVVDADAADKVIDPAKRLGNISKENAPDHFNFPLFDEDGNYNKDKWYVDAINDVVDRGIEDNWSGNTQYKDNPYKIWRYVTENTLPNIESQITVQSTGIVFKGRIIAGKEYNVQYSTEDEGASEEYYLPENVRKALSNFVPDENTGKINKIEDGTTLPILYGFDGFLYAGWEELIKNAAKDGKGGRLYFAVEKILKQLTLKDGVYSKPAAAPTDKDTKLDLETAFLIVTGAESEKKIDDKLDMEAFVREAAPDSKITVYEATDEDDGEGWGYYCYYFYWNRHNDNNKSGEMGNMEFATVRNNVYKITVEEISKFGHPIKIDDDPDPVDEKDPDEEPLKYIQVDVEVLPWVVRVNNVKF